MITVHLDSNAKMWLMDVTTMQEDVKWVLMKLNEWCKICILEIILPKVECIKNC